MKPHMMTLTRPALLAIASSITLASTLLAASPAGAEVQYPWCADSRKVGGVNCGFVNYRQCLATLSGLGGYCYQNPAYLPPPPRERTRRSKSQD